MQTVCRFCADLVSLVFNVPSYISHLLDHIYSVSVSVCINKCLSSVVLANENEG